MKIPLLAGCLLLMLCPAIAQFQGKKFNVEQNQNLPDKNWMQQAQNFITERSFEFKRSDRSDFKFYSANANQKIAFTFTSIGYKVSPIKFGKDDNIEKWAEEFKFLNVSRNGIKLPASDDYVPVQNKNILRFNSKNVSIEYINNDKGLRQNFIVNEKLEGSGNLELQLQLKGDLSPSVNNNELILEDKDGINRLFYRDLKVWDANHQPLDASMELRNKNTLVIIVDDQSARYPITIDPINQTPDWTTSAEGIVPGLLGQLAINAAYGFSVAGLGDVNGDGFDDVAVGAPAMVDIFPNVNGSVAAVGAVFVYFGSANGLAITPSAVLQPTTVVAGALFGYSIAGGDVNGDGKNDILVGAPLDNVSISIGGGNTASGKVGKAYVFNGANLATTTTPFLEIQLSGSSIITNVNISVNALFGFSVAVTEDLNNDGKKDMIIGAPTYAGLKTVLLQSVLDVQSGGAFVYLTKSGGNNTLTQVKLDPIKQDLLGLGLLTSNINGLLFGYAVDGTGDYNGDGRADVVATAPAGVLLGGKLLQGSAVVYYGTGTSVDPDPTHGAILTATSGGLITNFIGSIANVANLFGVSVKGVKGPNCARNGSIIVGAPLGNDIINVLGLDLKTGTVSVFKKKSSSPSGYVAPDQIIASPRNSNNILQIIQANLLFGYSLDNVCDINCDGYADIIVGEPISSGVQLINANVAGGAAYVYYGNASGTYQTSPSWTLTAYEDAFLGINATSLIGYSVAGAGRVKGSPYNYCILVGTPSRTLDFGNGLLNLGSTLGTLFSLTFGNNGVGKAYEFDIKTCDHSPVAVNDVVSTNEDVPVNGNVAPNDVPSIDCENTWSLEGTNGGAQHGTVTMNPDGNYTYTPAANYNGNDSFTYKLCDCDGDCSTATVTVTINPVDDEPVAVNDVATTNEDTPVNGNVSGNDTPSPDCPVNTWSLVGADGGALHGNVTMNSNGSYTYTPDADYNGSDVFTYQLCDCDGDCKTATVTVTIIPVDDAPIAVNDAFTTPEDVAINGTVTGNDTPSGDGGNVWSLVSGAAHGTATVNANGTFNYTPTTNYNGQDAFTYKVCDSDGDCSTATVNITVTPVDDAPIAVNDAFTTPEDVAINGTVTGNDTPSGDGGNVWSLVGGAGHGTATVNANGTFNYIPIANYNGPDAFTYKVCDADGDCSTATVNITITPVDDAPIAVNDAFTTPEDVAINGTVTGNDTPSGDGGNVWSLVSGAAHGTATVNANGTFNYTPTTNYNGQDAFTYKVCDADGDCSTATVNITVTPVDDVPVAVNDAFTTPEDVPIVNGNLAGNDTPSGDGGNVWSLVGGAAHGTATVNANGTFNYTPTANYNGPDAFTYKVCDADGDCSTATVNITITPVDDAPIAVNDAFTTPEDVAINGTVTGNDTPSGDGGNVWSLVSGAAHGTATVNANGTFNYTPTANYNGPDAFTYKVCDADGDCSTATVTVTVTPVDDVPVAVNDAFTTPEDVAINGTVTGNDTPSGDGGNIWSLVGGAAHGTATVNANGTFNYTPTANYNGPDAFTYKVCDADGDCSTATVNITVTPSDDVPIAVNDVNTTTANTPVNGNVSGNDTPSPDCTPNVWSLVGANGGALHGSVTMNSDGSYTYTPAANYSGSDVFTYKLCDCDGDCPTATVTISISSPCTTDATPPTINCPSNKTVAVNASCNFVLPDYRGEATTTDNCPGTITISQSPAPGTTLSGVGTTTVVLTATDAKGNTATCSFNVTRVDQTPPSISCPANKIVAVSASCSFNLPDYRGEAIKSDNCTASGSITLSQSPAPNTVLNGTGTTTVVLTATDASGNTSTCSFTVERRDQTSPVITCQSNKTITCNATLTFDTPTASDNCGQATISEVSITSTSSGTSTIHTKTWKATDGSGNTATCSQSVTQLACGSLTGNIYPTSTTCNSYLGGAQPLAQLCYSHKQNKVTNITPGVFFYFTTITAPSASFTVNIVQTKSCASFNFFAIQQGNQITAFNSSCTNAAGGNQTTAGQGSVTINNATVGAQYVIAVKYDSKSVQGSPFTGSAPICQYNFESRINGAVVSGSQASINLTPNCSSGGTITKQTDLPAAEETRLETQIGLYPNPASEFVNLLYVPSHSGNSTIAMYDISGKLVANIYQGNIEANKPYRRRVDIKHLSSGVYIIRFRVGEFIETKKLVITN